MLVILASDGLIAYIRNQPMLVNITDLGYQWLNQQPTTRGYMVYHGCWWIMVNGGSSS